MGDIPKGDLAVMQNRLGRPTYFLVPMNPGLAQDGRRFFWGVAYTKAENKNSLGFVFGHRHPGFLEALTCKIRQFSAALQPDRVLVCGYSMGGFGALHLGYYAPEIFDAVVSVAGYGLGTQEPSDRGFNAPQPRSRTIFEEFLDEAAPRLASVPVVIAVHAPNDSISSFGDMASIIQRVRAEGGESELIEVPDEQADSDPGRKKKARAGHHYFNYSLLAETSQQVFYQRLLAAMAGAGQRLDLETPQTPSPSGAANAGGRADASSDAGSGTAWCRRSRSRSQHRVPALPGHVVVTPRGSIALALGANGNRAAHIAPA